MKNILSFKSGTPILGKDIKKWFTFHTENETSHTKIARRLRKRFFNLRDDFLYVIDLAPHGTGCGTTQKCPIIRRFI